MDSQKGFAPIVIILVVVALFAVGAGGFVLVFSKNKKASSLPPSQSAQTETTLAPSPSSQTPKTEAQPPPQIAANPKEFLGWWEEEGGFPFFKEFTDEYFCTQYSSRSTCANNIRYRVEGNKILLEWQSGFQFYATWKMIGDKLELADGMGSTGKTLYKKISPPTSKGKITAPAVTRSGLAEEPKANIKLLKVGESGVCLKHDGGDPVPITRIGVKLNGNSASIQSFEQFPALAGDYIFDPGEFFVLAVMVDPAPEPFITFRVGDTVEIVDSSVGSTFFGPKKIDQIEPRDEDAPMLIGGFASCP